MRGNITVSNLKIYSEFAIFKEMKVATILEEKKKKMVKIIFWYQISKQIVSMSIKIAGKGK